MKIPEAGARLFNRIFVCRKCKNKQRAEPSKIRAGKIICRKCQYNQFRLKTKEKKVVK